MSTLPAPRPPASSPLPDPQVPGVDHDGPVQMRVAVHPSTKERVAFFTPGMGARSPVASFEQAHVVRDLQMAQFEAVQLGRRIDLMVRRARDLGVSWPVLAFSTGLSESGARKRFADPAEVVPGDLVDDVRMP